MERNEPLDLFQEHEHHQKQGEFISKDDILDLQITLESTHDVTDFLRTYGYDHAN